VFINIAGGLRIEDPGIDLGIVAAIVSSYENVSIDSKIAFIGEVGLSGEIRAVNRIEQRIAEAEKLGLNLPAGTRGEFMRQVQTKKPPEILARQLQNANIAARDLPQDKLTELFKNYQEKGGGNLYKVDLPDTHIRRMLDWDAPIKDQPSVVRNLAKKLGIDKNDLGGDLLAQVGKDEAGRKIMQDAGIRGIKYLDEKSRFSPHEVALSIRGKPYASNQFMTKEQALKYADEKRAEGFESNYKPIGTRNFVVFDPNHLNILERNEQAIK
jgi:hypothetical protein